MRIFLSYPSELKSTAEPIAFSLRSRGHKVFFDKDDLPPGKSYDDQIQKSIQQSDILIYLISPGSVEKGRYTLTEVEFARAAWSHPNNRVIPVMVQETDLAKIPSFLKGVSILEPNGNIAAEVGAAVERLRGPESALSLAAQCAAAAGVGILLAFTVLWILSRTVPVNSEGLRTFPMLYEALNALVSSFPLLGVLMAIRRSIDVKLLLPLMTMPVFLHLGAYSYFQAAGPIDTLPIYESLTAIPYSPASELGAADQADTETISKLPHEKREQAKQTYEQIDGFYSIATSVNQAFKLALLGAIWMLGCLLGSQLHLPELNTPTRWLISLAFGAVTASALGSILGESETNLHIAIAGWFALAGGLMGYWAGRGRPT